MIAIIKYKAGNTASVANALNRLGAEFYFAESPEQLNRASGVIFPGVGHALSAMRSLKESGIDEWIKQTDKPVLGICLGMQLLFEFSSEGEAAGLGIIPGSLQKFDSAEAKVPHMGWNKVVEVKNHPIMRNVLSDHYLYFVHSFYAPINSYTLASCDYVTHFTAIVAKDNYVGVQFHPEKSGKVGSLILQNFLDIVSASQKVKAD